MRYGLLIATFVMLMVCGCRQAEVAVAPPVEAPRADGAIPAALPPPFQDETPAHFLASVFDLPEAEITVAEGKHPYPDDPLLTEYACSYDQRKWVVRTNGPTSWGVRYESRLEDQGIRDERYVREVAEAVLKRRWGDRADSLSLEESKVVLGGPYQLVYSVQVAPDVSTGDSAEFLIEPDGFVVWYGELHAERQVRLEDVTVTRKEALAKAWTLLEARSGTRPKLKVSYARLTLSSDRHRERGPLWIVCFDNPNDRAKRQEAVVAAEMVFVDAMTGEATKAPGWEDIEPSLASPGPGPNAQSSD